MISLASWNFLKSNPNVSYQECLNDPKVEKKIAAFVEHLDVHVGAVSKTFKQTSKQQATQLC